MKRDFNCNNVHCGLPSLKPHEIDTRTEESTISDYDEEFCKDCAKEYQRLLLSDLCHGTIRNTSVKSEGKLIHNKENQQISWGPARRTNALESGKFHEDSGYSSLLSSPHEPTEHDDDIPLAGNLKTPDHSLIQNKSQLLCSKRNLLPVLHFEELVCSTLKRANKRNPKSWGVLLDKMVSRGSVGFMNLIGRKMGVDRLDILSELFHREFRHILADILRHLNDIDLINVAKVSTTWKKILHDDKRAFQTYNKALKLISNNSTKSSKTADTRKYVPHREVLALVQKASIVQNTSSKKASRLTAVHGSCYSRHTLFSEIAKTLKNTESLKICHRCNSPAKYDSHLQRAVCIRENCGFDFCTKCLCNYHNAQDCTSEKPVKPTSKLGPLPGTKKSKQNLRRL
ncbi:F-box only protein 5 [Heteronotia binoei]|uniref:F-box only protein 5 n=1 Tax=Heteronotia binoei TaxID=13085 RepID=UPI0029317ACD|nr:F-box only protein 5 [Heteronotia binoei]XP_060096926.1 F-box only protein 5 [Heteronotia binoei]XP_060096931.1 F-box only protein 5 [Heteronotia binoei]